MTKPKLKVMPADAQPLHTRLPPQVQQEIAEWKVITKRITHRALEETKSAGHPDASWAIAYMLLKLSDRLESLEYYLEQFNYREEEQRRVWEGIVPP